MKRSGKFMALMLAVSMVLGLLTVPAVFAEGEFAPADVSGMEEVQVDLSNTGFENWAYNDAVALAFAGAKVLSPTKNEKGTGVGTALDSKYGNQVLRSELAFVKGGNSAGGRYIGYRLMYTDANNYYEARVQRTTNDAADRPSIAIVKVAGGSETELAASEVKALTIYNKAEANNGSDNIEFSVINGTLTFAYTSAKSGATVSITAEDSDLTTGGYGIVSNDPKDPARLEIKSINFYGTPPSTDPPSGVPDNFTAEAGNEKAVLSWDAVEGANVYKITQDGVSIADDVKDTSYTASGLTNGTEYTFKVYAGNNYGFAPDGAEAKVTPVAPQNPPGIITGLKAEEGDGLVTLTWDELESASSYNVYYKASGGAYGAAQSSSTAAFTVTGLINDTEYSFKITGVNNVGEGEAAEITAAPTAPQGPEITLYGGYYNCGFLKWEPTVGTESYNVYYKLTDTWLKADAQLVRADGNLMRCDLPGLIPEREYTVKVVPVAGGVESADLTSKEVKITALMPDRVGFAFVNADGSAYDLYGGYKYNEDGSLASNVEVLYLTPETDYSTIAEAFKLREKSSHDKHPVILRVIGTNRGFTDMLDVKNTKNVTIEGIGEDAKVIGGGFNIRTAENVEVRNITFADYNDDGINLTTNTTHVYMHHCEYYHGYDGSSDMKEGSDFVTYSQSIYHQTGKSVLVGHSDGNASKDSGKLHLTMAYNWFEHSSSRHPRVRFGTVHALNNYYQGTTTYGTGSACDAQVLVEGNYFDGCKRPHIVSQQGSSMQELDDSGNLVSRNNMLTSSGPGYLKAVNNEYDSCKLYDPINDVRENGFTFNPKDFYSYTPLSASEAKDKAMNEAGVLKVIDPTQPPSAPTGLSISIDNQSRATLIWGSVYKAAEYEVQYRLNNGTNIEVSGLTDSSYILPDAINPDSTITFKVRAVNKFGDNPAISGDWSSEISASYSTPGGITNLAAAVGDGEFLISWTAAANALQYEVEISDGSDIIEKQTVSETNYSISNLEGGKAYTIKVKGISGALEGTVAEIQATAVTSIPTYNIVTQQLKDEFTNAADKDNYVPSRTDAAYTVGTVKNPDDSGDTVLSIVDSDKTDNTCTFDVTRTFPKRTDVFAVEFDMYCKDNPSSGMIFSLNSGATPAVVLALRTKVLADETDKNNKVSLGAAIAKNNWYNVKVVVDAEKGIYDVYVDDVLYALNFPLGADGVDSIVFTTPGTNNITLYIDDFGVYTVDADVPEPTETPVPPTDPPSTETPATEIPATDTPATETPATEEPDKDLKLAWETDFEAETVAACENMQVLQNGAVVFVKTAVKAPEIAEEGGNKFFRLNDQDTSQDSIRYTFSNVPGGSFEYYMDFRSGTSNSGSALFRAIDTENEEVKSYTFEKTDGRFLDIMTNNNKIRVVDYFSEGNSNKGLTTDGSTVLSSDGTTWYSLKVAYNAEDDTVKVYLKNKNDSEFPAGPEVSVKLAGGTTNKPGAEDFLKRYSPNINEMQIVTPGSGSVTMDIDNIKLLAEKISGETEPTDTPATETPATDTPATDTPATETPATETPATETPAVEHKVEFITGAGNVFASANVKSGEKVSAPGTAPTREGFTFEGWTTDAAGTEAYNFASAVTADIKLYAKFSPNPETEVVKVETEQTGDKNIEVSVYPPEAAVGEDVKIEVDLSGGGVLSGSPKVVYTTKDGEKKTIEAVKSGDGYVFTMPSDIDMNAGISVAVEVEAEPSPAPTRTPSSSGGSGSTWRPNTTPEPSVTEAPEATAKPTEPPVGPGPVVSGTFKDVSPSDWFFAAVESVSAGGVMTGTSADMFSPYDVMTRGMFVTVLGRLAGAPSAASAAGGFADVNVNEYYAPYVEWAAQNKIADGVGSGMFAPNEPITREQMAVILTRYEWFISGEQTLPNLLLTYTDAETISDWAVDSVRYCTDKGLMIGNTDGSFTPKGIATRAEAAEVLSRLK